MRDENAPQLLNAVAFPAAMALQTNDTLVHGGVFSPQASSDDVLSRDEPDIDNNL